MTATRQLAEFSARVASSGVPVEVAQRAAVATADALHAIILALPSTTAEKLGRYLEASPRPGRSSAAGRGLMDAEAAALYNASLAAVHEIDDVHLDTSLHPGAVIVPASLAAAELGGAPAPRFLAAVAVGYEVAVRLSRAAGYRHYHFFHAATTCGTVGAAAAASVALNLSADEIHRALGVAATSASGLWEGLTGEAVMVKHLHLGQAAERGIRAARLAALGWPGARRALEGPKGFLAGLAQPGPHAPAESADLADLQRTLTEGLGWTWAILRNVHKRYPFCLGAAEPLEGFREALRQGGRDAREVEAVLVEASPSVAWMVGNPDPKDEGEARFSVPYALSLVLAGLDPETVPMPSAWLGDERVRGWLPRVRIEGRPTIGRRKAVVTVTYRDGTRVTADQPLRSLTGPEVIDRLGRVARERLGPARGAKLARVVEGLVQAQDVSELGSLLRGDG